MAIVTAELIERVAGQDERKGASKDASAEQHGHHKPRLDVRRWLNRVGVKFIGEQDPDGRVKYHLQPCPFHTDHGGKCTSILQFKDGNLGFKCQHYRCIDFTIDDLFRKVGKPLEDEYEREPFCPPAHWQMLDGARVGEWACDPLRWIIEGIVALGNLVFVAAESQCGKTLVGLYIAMMMLVGGKLFGEFPINPVKRVLYLVLEDPPRRIKDRLLDMEREGDPVIDEGRLVFYVAPGLAINDDLQFAWLEELIQCEKFDIVFLDTYQRATPGLDSANDEKQSRILHRIADLTRKLGVTLWIHDHFRKTMSGKNRGTPNLNDIKGTGGKVQNADAFLLMDRTASRLRIQGSSKDSDKPIGFYVDIAPQGAKDEAKFKYAGTIEELAASARDKKARNIEAVRKALEDVGDWTKCEAIAQKVGLSPSTVSRHLDKLIEEGVAERRGKGKNTEYRLKTGGFSAGFSSEEKASCAEPQFDWNQ